MPNGQMNVIGDIAKVAKNAYGVYEGDLTHYVRVVRRKAQNLKKPYHNARHMFHVTYMSHEGMRFYQDGQMTPREGRALGIAALFHDFDHCGMKGDDDLNIEKSIRRMREHLLLEDAALTEEIAFLIKTTQYPYVVEEKDLTLSARVLRDADVSQTFSVAWIQQVLYGLAEEWGMSPMEVLQLQEPFLRGLKFHSGWARYTFPNVDIEAKIAEAHELLDVFGERKDILIP